MIACAACGEPRPLAELLQVTSRVHGWRYYVCRPGLSTGPGLTCFRRAVGPASVHSIALADPDADRAERERVQRMAT